MADFTPRQIVGNWRSGFAPDLHTLRSIFVGDDEFGHPRFETHRSEMGELLYRLKYSTDRSVVGEIVDAVARFLSRWQPPVEVLVPVPPSSPRTTQPVLILAEAISRRTGVPVVDCVRKTRNAPQLKNVFDLDERSKLLEGLHLVDEGAVKGKGVLLFDDLYRSGATMNSIAGELHDRGGATDIFALTITRTRSNQ